ncbi:MAG: DUF2182 domain-containing protein, partial [Sinobacteraceae bacterium]|nr:DUF2182 domain-containing protein [Nevskiaceae bacterium]
ILRARYCPTQNVPSAQASPESAVSGSQQHARCAWRHGFHIGVLCVRCCGGLMLILLVVGMMELRWMALITGAITLERLGRVGEHVARASGALAITLGVMLISRAVREI